jgi:Plavaka transposase
MEEDVPPSQDLLHLCGEFEAPLSKRPEIIKFSGGNVGAVYEKKAHIGNQHYCQSVSNSHHPNRYEPFLSKLDWEIARWAKTQGPGSNSLTELLSIEGVSLLWAYRTDWRLTVSNDKVVEGLGLSYKTAGELNKLIDQRLPGRPSFQQHEVMVGAEVCDIYLRDVVACVKALFANPNLAQYLVTAPEKHFTYRSDERKTRMYHDMHTGRWWWSTQVMTLIIDDMR